MSDMRKRKCHACERKIEIYKDDIKDIIFYKENFYHKSCFCELASKRSQSKRGKPADWQYALDNIEEFESAAISQLEYPFIRDDFNDYLIDTYDVIKPPDRLWDVVGQLAKGTYKRKRCKPVSLKILFETWKWGQSKLNKININNKMNNKGPYDGDTRILYDLAIIVGKVPNYLAYKAKQEAAEIERENSIKDDIRVDYSKIKAASNNNSGLDDINDLLEDLI